MRTVTVVEPVRYLWAVWGLGAIFLSLYALKPALFDQLATEGGVIESFAALFLMGASAVCALAVAQNKKLGPLLNLCLVSVAIVLFVMAMEEISWFQHVFHFKTPAYFSGNLQNETNLHNFQTDRIELIFYNGSFVLLVLLPFVKWRSSRLRSHSLARYLIGNDLVFFTAILGLGFSDDIQRSLLTQISCVLAALFLIYRAVRGQGRDQTLFLSFFILHTLATAFFYLYPEKAARAWIMTEYKEFFIALSFLVNARYTFKELRKVHL